jgi:hypothetical protein
VKQAICTYSLHDKGIVILSEHFYLFKEKENRRPEGLLNTRHVSSNSGSSGSAPKRYQSVFTEGTPLTSFGIRNDDNQPRSHSV